MPEPFAGFALPTSNTTYTPNQFFDVCLPHHSRGVVRLVGFMIRKTLGWCDAEGRPQVEQHAISYTDLEQVGISRDMIHQAIEEAEKAHFIRCVRRPNAKSAGAPAVTGLFELAWHEGAEYVKDPKRFRGFFAGEGNRTYIPNQFFDSLMPHETLAVVKVVGSVIRLSIGFANKWGHRRRNVALSYQHIQNYSRLRDRKTLSAAIQHAVKSNYIERVEEGFFDPDRGKRSKPAVYAVKWLNEAAEYAIGQKTLPTENDTQNRSENPTGIGQKTLPADRSEIPTDIEIKQTNKTLKQQDAAAAIVKRLREEGFDLKAAQTIALKYSVERIERQLQWIDRRNVKSNRLGLLRAAIQEDWSAPGSAAGKGGKLGEPNSARPSGASFTDALGHARDRFHVDINPTQP